MLEEASVSFYDAVQGLPLEDGANMFGYSVKRLPLVKKQEIEIADFICIAERLGPEESRWYIAHCLVWCNRSSSDNKGAIDADTLLWFEQESGFLSFQKASE